MKPTRTAPKVLVRWKFLLAVGLFVSALFAFTRFGMEDPRVSAARHRFQAKVESITLDTKVNVKLGPGKLTTLKDSPQFLQSLRAVKFEDRPYKNDPRDKSLPNFSLYFYQPGSDELLISFHAYNFSLGSRIYSHDGGREFYTKDPAFVASFKALFVQHYGAEMIGL